MIGSVFASHTLLGYPIVQRLGLGANEAVTVTIGATNSTDMRRSSSQSASRSIRRASATSFLIQVLELAVYVPLVLLGLSRATRFLMSRVQGSKEGQLLVMLLIVVIAAIGAEAIHLEGIIGAFLAGLAVNRAIQHTQAKEVIELPAGTRAYSSRHFS